MVLNPFTPNASEAAIKFAGKSEQAKTLAAQGLTIDVVHRSIYSIKPAASTLIKMFEPKDIEEVGIRNINNARLPKGQELVVTAVQLMAGTPTLEEGETEVTGGHLAATSFDVIPATLRNGEFSLTANGGAELCPKNSMEVFNTTDEEKPGLFVLPTPKRIESMKDILLNIELHSETELSDNLYLKVILHGLNYVPGETASAS